MYLSSSPNLANDSLNILMQFLFLYDGEALYIFGITVRAVSFSCKVIILDETFYLADSNF